jgi:hypothetical protein
MKRFNGSKSRLMFIVFVAGLVLISQNVSTANTNQAPIADAGLPRYAGPDPVVLDGTGSYDPDGSGTLSYTWQQISGPSVIIIDANTATPSIGGAMQPGMGRVPTPTLSGFVQTDEIQECEFELLVSDGELTSLPDTVKIIIVPDFGADTLRQENPPFDANKPTIIYFGGGNCVNGLAADCVSPFTLAAWLSSANIINFPNGYAPDSGGNARTYYKYGDMIIVYLSAVAPDYKQPIQTVGWSTGAMPAIDVGIHLNRVYKDARYAVNRVTHLDGNPACRVMENWPPQPSPEAWDVYLDTVELFLTSSVDGEQCWIDHCYGTSGYPYEPIPRTDILWVRTGLAHSPVRNWYRNSLTGNDMNKFNSGLVAGAYWSVIGPGKNLQLAPTDAYYFRWDGGEQSGSMSFYDETQFPGRLPEPVTLIGPEDGTIVDPNGAVFSCEVSENAVGYQLLFGSDPYRVMDYTIVSDTPEPPTEVITTFPFEQTFWTVRVYDEYGSTIYADPICIYPEIVEDLSETLVAHWKLDETEGDIAYDSAGNNDATVHGAVWTEGKIDGALQFDGFNDYVDCGDSEQLGPEQMTFSMWLKPEHMGGMRYIVARSKKDSDDIDYAIKRHLAGEIEFSVGQLGSDPVSVISQANTPLGEWSQVVVCLDGSQASIYINGQRDNSADYAERVLRGGYWLVISSLRANTRFYNGLIDDVRIHSRAVTP